MLSEAAYKLGLGIIPYFHLCTQTAYFCLLLKTLLSCTHFHYESKIFIDKEEASNFLESKIIYRFNKIEKFVQSRETFNVKPNFENF